MTQFKNKTVLITGGASGIGRIMAETALDKGASAVIIWDIHEQNMHQFKTDYFDKRLLFNNVDVSNSESVLNAVQKLEATQLTPDILILNAGIVSGKYFHEHLPGEIEKTIGVNILGCMIAARAFLPAMIKRKSGHIVTISSAAGMLANPGMAVYAASKWAVLGWSESLRLEMKMLKTGINITTVTPSFINTGMFAGAKVNFLLPNLKPEKAAQKIISGIESNKVFVRMPALVYLLPFLKGILPSSWFDLFIGKGLGVYNSMKQFKGRK
ncbi:MAG: SDR family oxidoreductase [Bacteroidales bacterium]|nr:SDR family oxidoreductase [Bacteroidales bacterium]